MRMRMRRQNCGVASADGIRTSISSYSPRQQRIKGDKKQLKTPTLSIESTEGGFHRICAFVLYMKCMLDAPD